MYVSEEISGEDWVQEARDLCEKHGVHHIERDVTEHNGEAPIWVERHLSDEGVYERIEVGLHLVDRGGLATVEVYGPRAGYGRREIEAEVNWSALGSCSATDAARYAALLAYAAEVAGEWVAGWHV